MNEAHPSFHARRSPDKPALIMAGSGETITYGQLDTRSNQGAHLLRKIGLQRGDMLAICMDNDPRIIEVIWAAQRAGLYYVGISTRLASAEIAHILEDSGAKAVIYSPRLCEQIDAACAMVGTRPIAMACGIEQPAFEASRKMLPETPIADEAPGRDMLYSSGTTGRPKGIKPPLGTGAIGEELVVTTLARTLFGMGEDSVFLSPAPLYHAAPLRFVIAAQQLGGTVVVMEKFDPLAALAMIERHRVTHAQWVPTHFVRMLKLSDADRNRHDLSSLACVFHAAAPCPVEIKQRMLAWWGPIIHEYYASTETIGMTSVTPAEWLERPGTVGRASLGQLHICDDEGEELPAGREGAVYFSDGPPLAYHNDPDKTREAHNDKGWATVGDVGWVDDEGYLYLTDRKSFLIISGGVNIFPQEVENLLIEHPAVADAAVVGAPDADMGERVVAVIQPADWPKAGPALEAELIAYLAGRIAKIKLPKEIRFRQELPREPTGKLMKRRIRDELAQAGAAS
ncbi:MAG: acyl-CoA synthetase [Sphingomonas sp.]|nr:MAG: acyl-CoA synthetase [Sphingomonas sp.]